MIWDNLREEEFEGAIERSGGLCVIPLGCIEKHGQHMPVGSDYIEAMDIALEAAKIEDAVIFPVGAWLGEVSCFHAFSEPEKVRLRGCIGIKQETILRVLEELCDEIARNGFRKILILNSHGGNTAMLNHFLRCQSYTTKPYATMTAFAIDFSGIEPMKLLETFAVRSKDFPYITNEDKKTLKEYAKTGYGGGHGDFRETALVMAHDKSLIAQNRYDAEDGSSTHRTDYLSEMGVNSVNQWLANFPNSYCSKHPPLGCTETIGKAMRRISAEKVAKIFKMLKADEDCILSAQMIDKQ